ncbi:MAG: hypothetical protein M3068_02260 [Gemmatimonadota bacterium]|nr:hypothetical protein [Gemmatimonadota bacterium]
MLATEAVKQGQVITRRALAFVAVGAGLLTWADLSSGPSPNTTIVGMRLAIALLLCWRFHLGSRWARAVLGLMGVAVLAVAIGIAVAVRPLTPEAWQRLLAASSFVGGTAVMLLSRKSRLFFAAQRAALIGIASDP